MRLGLRRSFLSKRVEKSLSGDQDLRCVSVPSGVETPDEGAGCLSELKPATADRLRPPKDRRLARRRGVRLSRRARSRHSVQAGLVLRAGPDSRCRFLASDASLATPIVLLARSKRDIGSASSPLADWLVPFS